MAQSVYLIALPLLAFFVLMFFGAQLSKKAISIVGVIGIAASAIFAIGLLWQSKTLPGGRQLLWTLLPDMGISWLVVDFALFVDPLALIMCVVVTFVSMWIALYSTEYMAHEEGICRFFAVVNLFVSFMLLLVLADNLWLLFMGWEGVGVCSYLLIGFYYREKKAELAAMKAFITTRIGDVFLMFAIFACALVFHTLDINIILIEVKTLYPEGSVMLTIIALCLLFGAAGKSAQLPLQTWLADAMWGPTPVSALIHAATMVTAGVYLIARMSPLFAVSSIAQLAVLIVGAVTMVLASVAALIQTDLKRILAYSTMSQIGLMFLALGAHAYSAAIFHLATHAFFKALLFLSAGVIGHAVHSYDLDKMGGLKKPMPLIFWLFLIGCFGLSGVPLVSAGYFSKEWILSEAFNDPTMGMFAYGVGVFGAFLTGLYTFRMVMLVFFGRLKSAVHDSSGLFMRLPLVVLAFFATVLGWLQTPKILGDITVFSHYLLRTLPSFSHDSPHLDLALMLLPTGAAFLGMAFAIIWYQKKHGLHVQISSLNTFSIIKNGLGFEWLYNKILVKPYVSLSRLISGDLIESINKKIIIFAKALLEGISFLHSARLSHYVSFMVVAALALTSMMVF